MSEFIGWIDSEYNVILDHNQEIVRCRDCKFSCELVNGMYDCQGELTEPWDYYNDEPKQNQVPPDGFCSFGERKESGDGLSD